MKTLDMQKLKNGKYYKGYCFNALVDGKIFEFESEKEAINFYADYEGECYKLSLVNGEITTKCIYSPYN